MSVLIKDMEMPKNCSDCDFESYPRGAHYCQFKMRVIESLERPDWCPLEEAEPVKHGRWIGIDDFPHETWECDRCGKIIETDEPPNYCENCGARMIDEVENG